MRAPWNPPADPMARELHVFGWGSICFGAIVAVLALLNLIGYFAGW